MRLRIKELLASITSKGEMALDLVEPGNDDVNGHGKQEVTSRSALWYALQ